MIKHELQKIKARQIKINESQTQKNYQQKSLKSQKTSIKIIESLPQFSIPRKKKVSCDDRSTEKREKRKET